MVSRTLTPTEYGTLHTAVSDHVTSMREALTSEGLPDVARAALATVVAQAAEVADALARAERVTLTFPDALARAERVTLTFPDAPGKAKAPAETAS